MQENQGYTRGHRVESGIIDWSDCKLSKEEIDAVIKPFIFKGFEAPKQEIYATSKGR